jgi:hypothetical protein
MYQAEADLAQAGGWVIRTLAGMHLHMLTEPAAVARLLRELADEITS